jgi:predicted TIM-barrel fold metal-dependent hydrolase
MIGPTTKNALRSEYTIDDLKSELDLAEIDRAMVYHSVAKEYDPQTGNNRLMDLISGEDRLSPVWVLLPEATGEMGSIEDILGKMIEEKVAMARVFPKDHNFSFAEWGCGTTLGALERAGIPLMIDLGQTSYDQVSAVCSSHPELKLILSDVAYRSDRFIYPLLELHPNLFIETARYQTHRGIEAICKRFGSSRLVFGSRVPDLACGPMAMTIRYARIGNEDRDRILGGNLARLMEGIGR